MSQSIHRPSEVNSSDLNTSKYTFDALVAMRQEFPDVDDETLSRFLIARNGDVSKSIPLFRNHLEWRKTTGIIKKDDIAVEAAKGRIYMRGYDRDGHPVIVWNSRYHSSKNRDLNDMAKLAIYWLEYAISKLPPGKSKVVFIINRIDALSDSTDIDLAKQITKLFSDNFPERLLTAVIYPSGFVFYGIWNIVRFFLDPVTQAKVKPAMSVAGVEEVVDTKYIPENMGGADPYVFNFADFEELPEVIAGSSSMKEAEMLADA